MSDDNTAAPAAAPAAPEPAPRIIENPMLVSMRGGTLTSAYQAQLDRQKFEAAHARKIEDSKRIAAERNPGEAKQKVRSVGGNRRFPGVVLEFREPRDHKVLDYVECELHVLEDGSLMLQMACVSCYHRSGTTENFHIRQKHRHFELDTRRQGEIWVDPDDPTHVVQLAGTINLTEPVTCPNLGCGKRFVIDDSVIRFL